MKKITLFALAALLLAACTPSENNTPQELTGISLNKKSIEVEVDDTYQLRVWYEPEEAEDSAPEVLWESDNQKIAKVNQNGKVTGVKIGKTTITATCGKFYAECEVEVVKATSNPENPENPENPDEPEVAGEFSVGAATKVIFSPGNLQYQASTKTWRFAEHQYDIIGEDNQNISDTYSGWIDLFGWGTGNNPTLSSTSSSDYSTFTDWGVKPISNGGNKANQWRTLTADEWEYLYSGRTNAANLRSKAIVNDVHGYIFLPDSWSLPSGLSFTADANDWTTNAYSVTDWAKMEQNGAVFLPAAGARNETVVYGVGLGGYYWSGTPCGEFDACSLRFDGVLVNPQGYGSRIYGRSVRLVR